MGNKPVKIPGEMRPIEIGCYTLHATGITIAGQPTLAEHEGVGDFIQRAVTASKWWLADWLAYGDTRQDWKERVSQVVGATGLTRKRVQNVRRMGLIEPARRRADVEDTLHEEVAGLEPEEQTYWLRRSAEEGWDRRELRLMIRQKKRAKILEGQAVLSGMYRVIYADPGWTYDNRQPSGSSQADHYPGMTIEEMCKLPVAAHALRNSILFMWTTAPIILQNPGAREVGEAWGFDYRQQIIWDKVVHNAGSYTGCQHEILTIWTRGSCTPDVPLELPDSVQVIRREGEHSAKPEEFRKIIEKHWTTGPYLELFARERTQGWDAFGNDARLWAQEAAPA